MTGTAVERHRRFDDQHVVGVGSTRSGLKLLERLDAPVAELHGRQLRHLSKKRLGDLEAIVKATQEASTEMGLASNGRTTFSAPLVLAWRKARPVLRPLPVPFHSRGMQQHVPTTLARETATEAFPELP